MENPGGGSSSTDSNFVSVIRFNGSKPPPPSEPSCQSAKQLEIVVIKLEGEVFSQYNEYLELEKENNQLQMKVSHLDTYVKHQEYEMACLKYEMEKIKQEKMEYNRKLQSAGDPSVVPRSSQTQLEVKPAPLGPKLAPQIVQVVPEVPLSPSIASDHGIDSTKEPNIHCKCGVKFTTRQNLREHIKYYTMRMNFQCSTCGIRKFGLNQLRTHMKVTHGADASNMASLKGCRLCGRLFDSLAQLHEHRRSEQ